MHYQFESKIAVEVPQKKSLLQKLCMVGGILAVLTTLATILMEGVHQVNFLTGVFVPLFLLSTGFGKRSKLDYVPTMVNIDLQNKSVIITYPSVKRHPNEASVSEIYEYSAVNIEKFQYSSELSAIRFYGCPEVTIGGEQGDNRGKKIERVVYLPVEKAQVICAEIERYLHITAERMDQ